MSAGKTLLQILWEELDAIVDRLYADKPPQDGRYLVADPWNEISRIQPNSA
jgi:hypothetical protein